MTKRKPINKKLRFDTFKRDEFICQYCGGRPPAVVLEIDHVRPVSKGGGNDAHNLLTSCFDCNNGKGARSLNAEPIDLERKREIIEERAAQVKGYDALLRRERKKQESSIDVVAAIFEDCHQGITLAAPARMSVRHFLTKLPLVELEEAMFLACGRNLEDYQTFKYFCGVCWNKIRDASDAQ